jgi:hypothetical protein
MKNISKSSTQSYDMRKIVILTMILIHYGGKKDLLFRKEKIQSIRRIIIDTGKNFINVIPYMKNHMILSSIDQVGDQSMIEEKKASRTEIEIQVITKNQVKRGEVRVLIGNINMRKGIVENIAMM